MQSGSLVALEVQVTRVDVIKWVVLCSQHKQAGFGNIWVRPLGEAEV